MSDGLQAWAGHDAATAVGKYGNAVVHKVFHFQFHVEHLLVKRDGTVKVGSGDLEPVNHIVHDAVS